LACLRPTLPSGLCPRFEGPPLRRPAPCHSVRGQAPLSIDERMINVEADLDGLDQHLTRIELALMASSAVSIESWSSSEAIRQLIRAGLEALRRKMGPGR
jgi:hypothetical protein